MNNKTLIDTVINDLSIKDTDVLAQICDALSKVLKDCVRKDNICILKLLTMIKNTLEH
jgi:hypothetical protein